MTYDIHDTAPARRVHGIDKHKIVRPMQPGTLLCFHHGVQLAVFHETTMMCVSQREHYARDYGVSVFEFDKSRCHADELVYVVVEDEPGTWACVHCIACEASRWGW